jgi:cytochrome oxidase assembly protein ShyY1
MTHCKTEIIKYKTPSLTQFGFALIPVLLVMLVILAAAASVWQWQRARFHESLALEALIRQKNSAPLNLNQNMPQVTGLVGVSGYWLANSTVYISPRLIEGRLGALLVSVLKYEDGAGKERYIAVQRGWAPQSQPNIPPNFGTPATGRVELFGELTLHVPHAFELQSIKPVSLGVWQNHSLTLHGELLNVQLDPMVLVLSQGGADADAMQLQRIPAQQTIDILKQKADTNKGYAFQWLGLALAGMIGLFFMWRDRFNLKTNKNDSNYTAPPQ